MVEGKIHEYVGHKPRYEVLLFSASQLVPSGCVALVVAGRGFSIHDGQVGQGA